MTDLHKALMYREGISYEEANEIVLEARLAVEDGEDPEEVLYELGLEPDYLLDLL